MFQNSQPMFVILHCDLIRRLSELTKCLSDLAAVSDLAARADDLNWAGSVTTMTAFGTAPMNSLTLASIVGTALCRVGPGNDRWGKFKHFTSKQ